MHEAVRDVVEPKWSIEILLSLSNDSPQNFSEIQEQFDTSNDVITARLRLLSEHGLVDRAEHSRKDVRYSITDRGEQFVAGLRHLETILRDGS
jgi:DNA-binding HxlR family transcriptional regulator